jgi:hypothetical protein
MIEWIRTSRLSTKNSLSLRGRNHAREYLDSWFRGGLVLKAHRLLYRSTLGVRAIQKKKRKHLDAQDQYAPPGSLLMDRASGVCEQRRVPVLKRVREKV